MGARQGRPQISAKQRPSLQKGEPSSHLDDIPSDIDTHELAA